VLLNNDISVTPDWLACPHAVRPHVGAVGAKLLYPDGTVQHAGVVVGVGGIAGAHLGSAPRRTTAATSATWP
jgi:hypothetical protein